MRKFVTAAATALTIGMLSVSAPAMADAYTGPQGNSADVNRSTTISK